MAISFRSFSLQRLDVICGMLNMEISELVQLMKEAGSVHFSGLSEAQEKEIVSDSI